MSGRTVAYVTSEITPFAKTGGLADVSAALPAHLHRAGHDVRVFAPLYSAIDVDAYDFEPLPGAADIPVRADARTLVFSAYRTRLPGTEVPVHFIHCPVLFDRPGLYTNDPDEHLRFALLSRAALECCQRMQWGPEIFHCHDWQTALVPLYLKTLYAWDRLFRATRSVLTIHNLGYQGLFPSTVLADLGLESCKQYLQQETLKRGRIGFLETGIVHADWLTTVSPTYAREISTESYGMGLHELLAARQATLTGILNGVDTEVWNPLTDPHIPFRYSPKSLWRKEKNKEALLGELSLPYAKRVPMIGMISRLVAQKGIDLLEEPLPAILAKHDIRLVVLANGEARFERFFEELVRRFPGKVHFHRGFRTELAHRIEAAADMFLMPSRYEPCGLNQMYSRIYGTVPIVRKTGGLADTVQLFDPKDGTGNGIVFEHPTPQGVRWAVESALELYGRPETWKQIVANAMAGDLSWDAQAPRYVELYDRVRAKEHAGV
ncbi:MAG: glycogen synthase [bacterium]